MESLITEARKYDLRDPWCLSYLAFYCFYLERISDQGNERATTSKLLGDGFGPRGAPGVILSACSRSA